MKKKDITALHTKDIKELLVSKKEIQDALFKLRLEKSQKKLKNLRSIFMKRKDIARILTVLGGKQ